MSKGLKLPLVFIFITLFLSIPVLFYFYTKSNNLNNVDVKGVYSEVPTKPGVTIRITSKGGTWNLHQFLCDDKDACLKSLNIGKSWGVVSGGITNNYEFNIAPNQKWDPDFKYIKLFVRSSWGSMSRDFVPTLLNQPDIVELETISNEGVDYNVILIPLDKINSDAANLVDFRDF